ncbi:hypothetical protein [Rhizobium sp. BK661]|uniref:hypothetical protein n=1 Tax=Rhizobium sp. BK661 TaxID=2586991 RepID=UPI0021672B8B|nr:hypothetical protein [Rhizobium sp. BK661]MCS3740223.1 Mor family transcriptional regulator [Rhizobium sp. BK661]
MLHYSNIHAQEHEKSQQLEDFLNSRPSRYHREAANPRELTGAELSILAELEALGLDDDNEDPAKGKIATNADPAESLVPLAAQGLPVSSENRCAVVTNTPPITSPSHTPKPLSERLAAAIDQSTAPAWKHASIGQKFTHAAHVAEKRDGFAFTLNLSLKAHKAAVIAKDPVRRFSHYINRELKSAGLSQTPYAFVFELSKLKEDGHQKLHIHGVVIADPARAEDLKAALAAAGGMMKGRAAARQVKLTSLYDAGGWNVYLKKDARLTAALLDRRMFINADLNRLTNEDWVERRASCSHKRRTIR